MKTWNADSDATPSDTIRPRIGNSKTLAAACSYTNDRVAIPVALMMRR
ncbi:hypothetical protein PSQ90_10310 [Devosia rhodophyticola]|uniref:Uncharacterized protein n=1 Tax=Devosia rhodophyticola TaxID=3026423 RepID=A0ABY7YTY8_9HYPH|nr:hypothetical protein [Devosia rhodophyticola]WDR04714.1 hypothetical protein PSQ90_10310 [Devosia rhodophyticola]